MDNNLEKVKQNIYSSFALDGLWEILFGVFLLIWGIAVQSQMSWFPGPSFVILYILVLVLKRRVTYPRIGYVKFAEDNKKLRLYVVFGATFLFNVIFFLLYTGRIGDFPPHELLFAFGVLTVAVMCLIGYWWKVRRLYVFAGLTLVSFIIYQTLNTPAYINFLAPGAIIWVFGIVLLFRFIKKYPRLDKEG